MSGQSASPKVNGQGAPRPAASNGHEGLISETELIYGEKIGSGGFGIVQRGQYKGRVVAMKTMTIGEDKKMDKAQLILSFAGEAKRMRQFSHPNIVTFIGYVLKRYSLVMEFMELGNLKKYIENRKPAIPWPDRFNFAVDICAGMFYLHSKVTPDGQKKPDLFHQDLKTSNVLLRNIDGRITAKICDFGLSVLRERSNNNGADSILSTGSGLHSFVNYNGGTLDYLAPELLMGNATGSGKKYTKACDVYSYGVVLYEISTLISPRAFTEHRNKLNKNVIPNSFYDSLMSCTNLNPASRPSFKSLLGHLQRHQKDICEFSLQGEIPMVGSSLANGDVQLANSVHAATLTANTFPTGTADAKNIIAATGNNKNAVDTQDVAPTPEPNKPTEDLGQEEVVGNNNEKIEVPAVLNIQIPNQSSSRPQQQEVREPTQPPPQQTEQNREQLRKKSKRQQKGNCCSRMQESECMLTCMAMERKKRTCILFAVIVVVIVIINGAVLGVLMNNQVTPSASSKTTSSSAAASPTMK